MNKSSENGWTFVELILVIALMSALFFVGAVAMVQGLNSFSHISSRSQHLWESSFALERMVKEVERLGDDNGDRLQSLQPTRITFEDDQGNNSEFRLTGNSLFRNNDLLLTGVTGLTFTGYRQDGATTGTANQVRRLRIQLSAVTQGQTAPIVFQTQIFLRNFMYENFQ